MLSTNLKDHGSGNWKGLNNGAERQSPSGFIFTKYFIYKNNERLENNWPAAVLLYIAKSNQNLLNERCHYRQLKHSMF